MGLFRKVSKKFAPEYKRMESFPLVSKEKEVNYKEELLKVVEKLGQMKEEIIKKLK